MSAENANLMDTTEITTVAAAEIITTAAETETASPKDNNNMSEKLNRSIYLNSSQCSQSSDNNDLSLSLLIDHELEHFNNIAIACDELPAFEIRLMSPHGRTPSPINNEDGGHDNIVTTPKNRIIYENLLTTAVNNYSINPNLVALQDINAQISPPSDADGDDDTLSRTNSLETIYEGVFLSTPPRKRYSVHCSGASRNRITFSRMTVSKEKQLYLIGGATPPRYLSPYQKQQKDDVENEMEQCELLKK